MELGLAFAGFLIGGFVIAMGGGGAAFYLGILTGVLHIAPASAAATSLFTALPSLLIGAYSHYRTGHVRLRVGNRMLLTAIPATVVGSLCAHYISTAVYQWLLFLIFMGLGIQVLWQSITERTPPKPKQLEPWKAAVFGIISGLMVGVAGLSGGSALVAGMLLMGLSMQEAAVTSAYALIVTSIVGLLMHSTTGAIDWRSGIALMVGAILGSALMPLFLNRFDSKRVTQVLRPLMGAIMLIMAVATVF